MSLEIALTAIAAAMNRIADALENNGGEASDGESPNASAPAASSGKRGRKSTKEQPAQTATTEASNVTPSMFAEPTAATDANPAKSSAPGAAASTAPATAGTPPADSAAPNAGNVTISPEQEKALRKPLNDKVFALASSDMKACQGFLAEFGVKRAGEIPLARLDEAMAAITKLTNPTPDASSLI